MGLAIKVIVRGKKNNKKTPKKQCDAKTSPTDPFTGFGGGSSGPFCLVPRASHRAGAAPRCHHLQEVEGARALEGLQQLLIREVVIDFCRVSLHPEVRGQGGLRQFSYGASFFWQGM